RVTSVEGPKQDMMKVGQDFGVNVDVHLGNLSPNDVEVQLCYGILDAMGEVSEPALLALTPTGKVAERSQQYQYAGAVACTTSGQFGFSIRVLPKHAHLPNPYEPALVTWG
ncbi:MAG: alpha-glucan phosphorylase, partial [Gemmataceae bacterium]